MTRSLNFLAPPPLRRIQSGGDIVDSAEPARVGAKKPKNIPDLPKQINAKLNFDKEQRNKFINHPQKEALEEKYNKLFNLSEEQKSASVKTIPRSRVESYASIFTSYLAKDASVKGPKYKPDMVQQIKEKISEDQAIIFSSAAERTRAADRFSSLGALKDIPKDQRGLLNKAARALSNKKKILICIGSITQSDPITQSDKGKKSPSMTGIQGALILGVSARDLGLEVTYVTDEPTGSIIEKLLKKLPLQAPVSVNLPKVHRFKAYYTSPQENSFAKIEATGILKGTKADAVIAIELPDAYDDDGKNGDFINGNNKPIYEVVRAANAENLLTVSINSGRAKTVGLEKNRGDTRSTFSVPAAVSNFTSMALGALLLKYRMHTRPAKDQLDRFIDPKKLEELNEAIVYAGEAQKKVMDPTKAAFGKSIIKESKNSEFRVLYRDLQKDMLMLAKGIAEKEKIPKNLTKPTEIAIFDSSNGGLVADGLGVCEAEGAVLVGMACNTACTVPNAQKAVRIPVVDLIQVTSKAIVKHGGKKPVLISTEATTISPAYPNAVSFALSEATKETKPEPEPKPKAKAEANLKPDSAETDKFMMTRISGRTLADKVNELGAKLIKDREKTNEEKIDPDVVKLIKKIVKKIPDTSTSVWLTCTHYPAFKMEFERALHRRGLGHIEVINPMIYQAEAIIEHFSTLELKDNTKLGKNTNKGDLVISSASEEDRPRIEGSVEAHYRPTHTHLKTFSRS